MTHSEKVLALLSDGEPHSHREMYGLYVMAHSRVSDLRKRGHDIRCWREGDLYWYKLAEPRQTSGSALSPAGDSDRAPSPRKLPVPGNDGARQPQGVTPAGQLSFEESKELFWRNFDRVTA